MSSARKTLYILDGSAYIFRAFYANPTLSTSSGYPTSALMGFTGMLRKILKADKPDYIAVAFDISAQTFRVDLYPEYKSNRATPPSELLMQIPRVRELVQAMNIPTLEQADVEADDLIASAVKKFKDVDKLSIVICSADKDLMQLLDRNVIMVDSMRDKVFTVDDVRVRFQVPPEKVIDVLALAGDTSDNIPGVPGIGEKTAGALISEFGSLENLLANIDKVSGKKRKENLEAFADQARISQQLVRLKDDCPIPFELADMAVRDPDWTALGRLYQEFEFSRLLGELDKERRALDRSNMVRVTPDKDYRMILTLADLDAAILAASDARLFSFDLETTSIDPLKAEIVGMSMAWEDHKAVYVPLGHRYLGAPRQIPLDVALERVKPLLESEVIGTLCHNVKYEWMVLERYGIALRGVRCDTMLASYLVDPSRLSHSLDALALDVLSYGTKKFEEVAGKGKKQVTFDMVLVEDATFYAAEDADVTRLLYGALWPDVEIMKLAGMHDDMELPLARVLAVMEQNGIRIDVEALRAQGEVMTTELAEIEKEAHAMVGAPFNLNSPTQLRKILFEDLGLKSGKRTKSGMSTDQSVLEKIAGQHPLPGKILEHRTLAKLKSTYIDAIPALMHTDGRVHTDFNQAVAATGRLSSSNPNLQNIPIRTQRGKEIRRAFVPAPGHLLLSADYSQIELRLLAHLSGDAALCDAFQKGEDIHRRTAAEIFNIPQVLVDESKRRAGKVVNFGVVYGMGSQRLARDLGIKREKAADYIEKYFERYSGVKVYFDGLVDAARAKGYAETMLGRRRPIPELGSPREDMRALGERLAVNIPIQVTAADLIKLAMIRIQRRIEREAWPAKMLLQVHDELVFEVAEGAVEGLRRMVREEMTGVHKLKVPLVVDTGVGTTWLDAK